MIVKEQVLSILHHLMVKMISILQKHNLEIKDIISDSGIYKEDTPLFSGLHVFKADSEVIKALKVKKYLIGVREYSLIHIRTHGDQKNQ